MSYTHVHLVDLTQAYYVGDIFVFSENERLIVEPLSYVMKACTKVNASLSPFTHPA